MTRPPPRLTPFPYPTLFRSTCSSSPRPRCGAFLRLALPCVNAVAAQDVADDDRDAAERGERRRVAADADLHAAVERVTGAQLVDRTRIDGRHSHAVNLLPRKPE